MKDTRRWWTAVSSPSDMAFMFPVSLARVRPLSRMTLRRSTQCSPLLLAALADLHAEGSLACLHLLFLYVSIAALLLLLLPPRPSLLLQWVQEDHHSEGRIPAHESSHPPHLPPLQYPHDAEAHFAAVHTALRPWLLPPPGVCGAGFCGEKVEDMWMHRFAPLAGQRWPGVQFKKNHHESNGRLVNVSLPPTPLRRHFGTFIPIFVPWNRWLIASFRHGRRYPHGLLTTLRASLRQDVQYITVAQDDEGLVARLMQVVASVTCSKISSCSVREATATCRCRCSINPRHRSKISRHRARDASSCRTLARACTPRTRCASGAFV